MRTTVKTCFKCGAEKPLAEFYKHSQMADGHLNKCKVCAKEDVSKNRSIRRDYYNAFDRSRATQPSRVEARLRYAKTEAGKAASRRSTEKFISKYPEKRAAHIVVGNAIRDGKLVKHPCEKCGDVKVHAHHENYSKPLEVRWLCTKHHRDEHRA